MKLIKERLLKRGEKFKPVGRKEIRKIREKQNCGNCPPTHYLKAYHCDRCRKDGRPGNNWGKKTSQIIKRTK